MLTANAAVLAPDDAVASWESDPKCSLATPVNRSPFQPVYAIFFIGVLYFVVVKTQLASLINEGRVMNCKTPKATCLPRFGSKLPALGQLYISLI